LYEQIRVDHPADHVAQVVLDRPAQANAITPQMLEELYDAVVTIEADDEVRVWLLTGADRPDGRRWFSSGLDLRAVGTSEEPSGFEAQRLVDRIDDMLKPSIAVIGGLCTTGAMEIVLACDLRLAGRSARMSDLHLQLSGLGIGGWGLAARLSRLVGVDKAKELLLLSAEIDGAEAARIGLANRVVEDDALDAYALEWATTIASRPRRGIRTTLGYLALQAEMSKRDAMRWGELAPELMGLKLRPFSDAAARFLADRDGARQS
jgi:enoyl-CoA hydratase/carnithine racemase